VLPEDAMAEQPRKEESKPDGKREVRRPPDKKPQAEAAKRVKDDMVEDDRFQGTDN
jgi:hypothetical protein